MSKKDGPIVVKLAPGRWERLMLGDIGLCSGASEWLRAEFPAGGSFRDAWERCPRGEWIAYVAWHLARQTGKRDAAQRIDEMARGDFRMPMSADLVRAAVAYEQIEGWLRQYMAGRPEVIG